MGTGHDDASCVARGCAERALSIRSARTTSRMPACLPLEAQVERVHLVGGAACAGSFGQMQAQVERVNSSMAALQAQVEQVPSTGTEEWWTSLAVAQTENAPARALDLPRSPLPAPRDALATSTASQAALQLAALAPGTSSHSLALVASSPHLDASSWRNDSALRATHWKCVRCDVLMPKDDAACRVCTATRESMSPYAGAAELAAMEGNTQWLAYGRRALFLQSNHQVEAEGVAATPGTAGYANTVFAATRTQLRQRRVDDLLEEKVHPAVCKFDGWLALTTSARLRVWSREHVRTFVQDDDVEPLTTEYVQAHARVVSIPGCDKPVQVFVHVEGSNRWVP